ncbi:ATP-dependent Clp protease proteolytic subunit [Chroococcidiopsis thermalis]|uniref:ATP-dependent Clp protease proteolytic subunit n=1 Tax=Chroococcidiopsis thermalis (strain PCC 7203) TaxID=251229 RepID=K9TX06_CHRTP|nr:ATP-dependent Clp protease proteolytic subunit [Chroococcidiopsis thermalis]AFY87110.1 ATP-dependent Clp protease proteolytic subunit ClpP [Chroococcidiopsis thermalis PCC 7203]PSB42654.1 ATP-dependent Clp protease proteolytic subunit [Cyanosarcina cf. burmensis CCALA 770]
MSFPKQSNIPFFPQFSAYGESYFNIYSRLLATRVIFLRGDITEEIANSIVAQMLFLDTEDSGRDIFLYINSSGGSVTAALTIYDTMTQIQADICTVCVGTAKGMAALLLSSGTKGKRSALPNARIAIAQPLASTQGKVSDIEVTAREIAHLRETVNSILSINSDRAIEQIKFDTEREFYLNAEAAKEYGLIDNIIQNLTV